MPSSRAHRASGSTGTLDAAHPSPLADRCKAPVPDGVGAGAQDRRRCHQAAVLVIPGLLPDGRKGIIDLQPVRGESVAEWECLPTSLHRRGLTGEGLER